MLCLVPALVLVLGRCAAQEYSPPPPLGTVALPADSAVSPQPATALPNLVESLRRELMYNNYDYKHLQDGASTVPGAAARAAGTTLTRTAQPPLVTAAAPALPPTPDVYVRANQYELNEQSVINTAPDEQYTQYQMDESSMVPLQYAAPGAASMPPPLQRSSAMGGPARLPPPQGSELYSQGWEHEELSALTSAEQVKQELNRDLLYYVNDDRLKSGVNFRRYNDEHVHEDGEPYSSAERYIAPPPGLRQTTKPKRHTRRHRHRHRHMQREDLYVGRRANKRRGLGRAARRGVRRPHAPPASRHHGASPLRRRRPRLPYRYVPRHRRRGAVLNQMRRGFRQQIPANSEDIERRVMPAGPDYPVTYNRTEKSAHGAHELDPHLGKYERDSLSEWDNGHAREHNARHYDEQYDQFTKKPYEFHFEQHNGLEVNKSDDHAVGEQVNAAAGGRRDYEQEGAAHSGAELSAAQLNVSTVELTRTTYKYKLLQAGGARGGRRSGGGEQQVVQERGAGGVRLVALGGARFPQFRLPRARRQYMHQRAAAGDPLADLLPRRASR